MSFIYCKTCNWEQDDFWTWKFKPRLKFWKTFRLFGYNPLSCFIDDFFEYLRPRWIHFDDSFIQDLIRWKYNPVVRIVHRHYEPNPRLSAGPDDVARDYVAMEIHSWWMVYYSWKRNWRKYHNMKWPTYKKWKADPNRHTCPRCGKGLTED